MSGRTCVVTGASSGIGEATALLLTRAGDRVVMVSRDRGRTEAARDRVRAAVPDAKLEVVSCDLASLRSIRAAAAEIRDRHAHLDVLVHDAGVVPERREETEDGLELTLAVTFLGPWLLTSLLLPALRHRAPTGRIVNLAGIYHREGVLDLDDLGFVRRAWALGPVNARAQLARVVGTVELARRLSAAECTVNAVHPGAVRTHAQDHAPVWAKVLIATVARPVFVGPEEGARPVAHLAGAPALEGVTGRFFDRLHEAELVPAATDRVLGSGLFARATELVAARWPADVTAPP